MSHRAIGRLLAKLFLVERQLSNVIATTEHFKVGIREWSEYERVRKHISDKHFLEGTVSLTKLQEAIDDISGTNPTLAVELARLIEQLMKAKVASFSASQNIPDAYVRMLSAHEVGLELAEKRLIRIINGLAWEHSIITYLRVKFIRIRAHRGMKRNKKFLESFLAEIRATIGANNSP